MEKSDFGKNSIFVWKKAFFVWKRDIFVWKKSFVWKRVTLIEKSFFCVEKRYFCVEKNFYLSQLWSVVVAHILCYAVDITRFYSFKLSAKKNASSFEHELNG